MCAANKSPCTRSRFRPRVGKWSVVSTPTFRWTTSQTAQADILMRAIGAVGDIDDVRARLGQQRGAGQQFMSGDAARRVHFYGDGEFPRASFCANWVGDSWAISVISSEGRMSTWVGSSGRGIEGFAALPQYAAGLCRSSRPRWRRPLPEMKGHSPRNILRRQGT